MRKILSLEMTIVGLKMIVQNGQEKINLKFQVPPQIPADQPGQFSLSGQLFLHWAAATLNGHVEFQNDFF